MPPTSTTISAPPGFVTTVETLDPVIQSSAQDPKASAAQPEKSASSAQSEPEPGIDRPDDPKGRVSARVTFIQRYSSGSHGCHEPGTQVTQFFKSARLVRRLEEQRVLVCDKMVSAPEM